MLMCTLTSSIKSVNVHIKVGGGKPNGIKPWLHKSIQQAGSYVFSFIKGLSEASGFLWELMQFSENASMLHQFL